MDIQAAWRSLMRGKRGLIFDKDGTLLDSEEGLWWPAYVRLLQWYGLTHTREVHALMLGASDVACVRILQQHHRELPQDEAGTERLLRERIQTVRDIRGERGIKPMPGAIRFLSWTARERLPIAIATSSNRAETDAELKSLYLDQAFGAIVTADDVVNRKPHPEPFLKAARMIGVDPEACIAFEDGEKGVRSAKAAGMSVVFLRDARFNPAVPSEADLVIESFEQLLDR